MELIDIEINRLAPHSSQTKPHYIELDFWLFSFGKSGAIAMNNRVTTSGCAGDIAEQTAYPFLAFLIRLISAQCRAQSFGRPF
jgi:hypothetical protein